MSSLPPFSLSSLRPQRGVGFGEAVAPGGVVVADGRLAVCDGVAAGAQKYVGAAGGLEDGRLVAARVEVEAQGEAAARGVVETRERGEQALLVDLEGGREARDAREERGVAQRRPDRDDAAEARARERAPLARRARAVAPVNQRD